MTKFVKNYLKSKYYFLKVEPVNDAFFIIMSTVCVTSDVSCDKITRQGYRILYNYIFLIHNNKLIILFQYLIMEVV